MDGRHSVNLISGTASVAYGVYRCHMCDNLSLIISLLLFLTTVIFHGAHVCGESRWANSFMKYDVSMVCIFVMRILFLTNFDALISFAAAGAFIVWSLTFLPGYKRIPLNPVITLVHLCGMSISNRAMNIASCI